MDSSEPGGFETLRIEAPASGVARIVLGVEWFAHPWALGPRKARELLFLAESWSADEAHRLGMVNRVVPRERLDDTVLDMAVRLAGIGAAESARVDDRALVVACAESVGSMGTLLSAGPRRSSGRSWRGRCWAQAWPRARPGPGQAGPRPRPTGDP